MDLMSTNAKGKHVRGKNILLYGTCVEEEHPEYLDEFGDYEKFSFCPEKEHINMAFYKLIAMLSVAGDLAVLTVDGSPHCVQMHYIAEEVKRYSRRDFEVKHYVIEKGEMVEISPRAVKVSRYLSKVQKLVGD